MKINDVEVIGATLLSEEEIKNVPVEILACGERWWLRDEGSFFHSANGGFYPSALQVNKSGYIDNDGIAIKNIGAVRPAFVLGSHNHQVGDVVEIYGIKSIVVRNDLALVNNPIGHYHFDKEEPVYEESAIKNYIERWLGSMR